MTTRDHIRAAWRDRKARQAQRDRASYEPLPIELPGPAVLAALEARGLIAPGEQLSRETLARHVELLALAAIADGGTTGP